MSLATSHQLCCYQFPLKAYTVTIGHLLWLLLHRYRPLHSFSGRLTSNSSNMDTTLKGEFDVRMHRQV
uniref:Uncharacterized protein n=1 Tax=Leersia perrieri TaxID=77586 RepID=A0A0D9X207_9ORYZ